MWLRQPLFRATAAFVLELYCSRSGCNRFSNRSGRMASTLNASSQSASNASSTVAADPYKSSTFIGHSLWLVPSGNANQSYTEIITATAQELGSFQFIPHITLVAAMLTGEEDVVQRARQLAAQIEPYQFELEEVSFRDAYFQCVYAKMKLTPEVVAANDLARQVFVERQSDPPYMPHLSMVYGDLTVADKTNTVIPKITAELKRRSSETQILPVDSIQVWSTQGDVKDWYWVETIPLTGTNTNTTNTTTHDAK